MTHHFGEVVDRCGYCDKELRSESRAKKHRDTAQHWMNKARADMSKLLNIEFDSNSHYVYCITITPAEETDNREFYYVGVTSRPFERMREHLQETQGRRKFPAKNGDGWTGKNYKFVSFKSMEKYEDRGRAELRERKKTFEVSKKYDVDLVLGGH